MDTEKSREPIREYFNDCVDVLTHPEKDQERDVGYGCDACHHRNCLDCPLKEKEN